MSSTLDKENLKNYVYTWPVQGYGKEFNLNCTYRAINALRNYSVQVEPWPSGPGNSQNCLYNLHSTRVFHINWSPERKIHVHSCRCTGIIFFLGSKPLRFNLANWKRERGGGFLSVSTITHYQLFVIYHVYQYNTQVKNIIFIEPCSCCNQTTLRCSTIPIEK